MTGADENVREISTAAATTRRNASNKISVLGFANLALKENLIAMACKRKKEEMFLTLSFFIFCSWGKFFFFSPPCGTGIECEGKGQNRCLDGKCIYIIGAS